MKLLRNVALLGLLSLLGWGAFAFTGDAAQAGRNDPQPCRFDVQRFCHGVPHGQGRIVNCLLRHWDELTPACKKDVDDRRQKR